MLEFLLSACWTILLQHLEAMALWELISSAVELDYFLISFSTFLHFSFYKFHAFPLFGGCRMMMHHDQCSGFGRFMLCLSEMQLVWAPDMILCGSPYLVNTILQHIMRFPANRVSALLTGKFVKVTYNGYWKWLLLRVTMSVSIIFA